MQSQKLAVTGQYLGERLDLRRGHPARFGYLIGIRKQYADRLGPVERARLERSLRAMATEDGLTEAVVLLEEGRQGEARRQVLRLLSQQPRMAFTRIGAASFYRVMTNRRRYS